MPAFFEYLQNITYYLMFAAVVGIFVPSGRYRKFVSMVLGFVLLLLMIQPLSGFLRGQDIPVTQWFAGGIDIPEHAADSVYADWWVEYLSGAFEAQLETQLSRLLENGGYVLHSAEFAYSEDFGEITAIRVSVSRAESREAEQTTERVPFIRIQPPGISPIYIGDSDDASQTECPDTEAVKTLISQFYNLPKSHIYVNVSS